MHGNYNRNKWPIYYTKYLKFIDNSQYFNYNKLE